MLGYLHSLAGCERHPEKLIVGSLKKMNESERLSKIRREKYWTVHIHLMSSVIWMKLISEINASWEKMSSISLVQFAATLNFHRAKVFKIITGILVSSVHFSKKIEKQFGRIRTILRVYSWILLLWKTLPQNG